MDGLDDEEIQALVTRLARPHPSGGAVIERSAILAAGADFQAVMAWIAAHDGKPETAVAAPPSRGLHGPRVSGNAGRAERFVLPAGTLT
jgi:hypothetical protein